MPLAQKEGRVAQKKVTFLGTQELAAEEFKNKTTIFYEDFSYKGNSKLDQTAKKIIYGATMMRKETPGYVPRPLLVLIS